MFYHRLMFPFLFIITIVFLISLFEIENYSLKISNIFIQKDISSKGCNISVQNTTIPPLDVNHLSLKDYTQLINLSNFRFLKLSLCNETQQPLKLLVVVHSAPQNIIYRETIRKTWGNPRLGMKMVFAVGITNQDIETQLDIEQKRYNDLIQGNFVDAYKNLTYKHVMVLKYAVYHCPTARYILKTDDDVFINTPVVMSWINEYSEIKLQRLLFCSPMYYSPALRDKNKWQVTFEEFPGDMYPPYCSGFAAFVSPDTAISIYNEAQRSKYFWIDDVLIYGMARERTNIEITPIASSLILRQKEMFTLLRINNSYPSVKYSFLVGPMNINPVHITALWDLINNQRLN